MEQMIRLYDNPLKQVGYLLGSLVFVAVGVLFLVSAFDGDGTNANPANIACGVGVAIFCVTFFGLCAGVVAIQLLRRLLVRHPLLQVDASGWTYTPALGQRPQHVSWEDVGSVAILRQRASSARVLYLVVATRSPDTLPPSRLRTLNARFYPALAEAGLIVPLNAAYLRATPTQARLLLGRIRSAFPEELRARAIPVDDAIREM